MPNTVLEQLYAPTAMSLDSLIYGIYQIPIYQRPYSWEKKEIDDLLQDLYSSFSSYLAGVQAPLFLNTIHRRDKGINVFGRYQSYELIDGQQRIATLAIILLEIYCLLANTQSSHPDWIKLRDLLWKRNPAPGGTNTKDKRFLELGSIEKNALTVMFDNAFDDSETTLTKIRNQEELIHEPNVIERLLFTNAKRTLDFIENKVIQGDPIFGLQFLDFCLQYVSFVVIDVKSPQNQFFQMFESINFKGKRLDEIDRIKVYIFGNLPEVDVPVYTQKWGNLIIKTNDRLEDYLNIYVRAYLSYYKDKLDKNNVAKLAREDWLLKRFMRASSQAWRQAATINEIDAMKYLLDDMELRVDSYRAIKDIEIAKTIVNKKEFLFFYRIAQEYDRLYSLLFRIFTGIKEGTLSKEDATKILKAGVQYMVFYQTIGKHGSKESIELFKKIHEKYHAVKNESNNENGVETEYFIRTLNKDEIVSLFKDELRSSGLSTDKLNALLSDFNAFENHGGSWILLTIYEGYDVSTDRFSYDKMISILDTRQNYHLDHWCNKTPNKEDPNLKYYCEGDADIDGLLVLKEGHDFIENGIFNGMKYREFRREVLNKIGNLKRYEGDSNIVRGNTSDPEFCKYKHIKDRNLDIATKLTRFWDL